jgi:hypothetical protein
VQAVKNGALLLPPIVLIAGKLGRDWTMANLRETVDGQAVAPLLQCSCPLVRKAVKSEQIV